MHPLARWLVKPSDMAFTSLLLSRMLSSWYRLAGHGNSIPIDPHTGVDATNDPTLVAIHCVGLDILGLFPRAIGGYRYLYVAIDKFTKWPKLTPVVKIKKQFAVMFIKLITYRFGVLNRIITDNGS
jgi:hypothetical protein